MASYITIHAAKPGFMYNSDGSLRQFGVGRKFTTVIPAWLVAILMAIFLYGGAPLAAYAVANDPVCLCFVIILQLCDDKLKNIKPWPIITSLCILAVPWLLPFS